MKIPSKAEIEYLKKVYPVGSKIQIDHMDDPQAIPSGSVGTVRVIDSMGQIHLKEFGLALIPNVDQFHKYSKEE